MPSRLRFALVGALLTLSLGAPAPAAAASNANVAALQVALRALHHYDGSIDGVSGPATKRAVRRFQKRKHLTADGVAGARTRKALGRRGRPPVGSRVMRTGHRGWDVAALQFMLRRRGFSPGSIDGGFGPGTAATLRRYQSSAGLTADGRAGSATLRALRRKARRTPSAPGNGPVRFLRPLTAPVTSPFGMRWGRPHQGIDFGAPTGSRIGAAGRGVVEFAGWNSGGYGNLVVVQHRLGFETWYAHQSRVTSSPGQSVSGGTIIGYVGSTGHSTGPHLHFEVRLNGVPINPAPRLLSAAAAALTGMRPPLEREHECSAADRERAGRTGFGPPAEDPARARLHPCD